jgi:hypothetical protein
MSAEPAPLTGYRQEIHTLVAAALYNKVYGMPLSARLSTASYKHQCAFATACCASPCTLIGLRFVCCLCHSSAFLCCRRLRLCDVELRVQRLLGGRCRLVLTNQFRQLRIQAAHLHMLLDALRSDGWNMMHVMRTYVSLNRQRCTWFQMPGMQGYLFLHRCQCRILLGQLPLQLGSMLFGLCFRMLEACCGSIDIGHQA